MIWANKVLPVFMTFSKTKLGILAECDSRIQIGDTPRRSEILFIHGLWRFVPSFNRTADARLFKQFSVLERVLIHPTPTA